MSKVSIIPFRILAVVALMTMGSLSVGAADMGYDDPNSKYDAAKARCEGMSGSEKEHCLKQAKEIRNEEQSGNKAERKQLKEQYKADKQKCEAMNGSERDNCIADLKAKYQR